MAWILLFLSLILGVHCTHYTFTVNELVPMATYIGQVTEVTSRPDDTSIHISPSGVPFHVDLHTGGVYVTSILDREAISIYNFDVLESIDGVDTLLANVTVYISDVNDNAPVFSRQMYNVSIKEGTPISTKILRLRAMDADVRSQLVYNILTNPSPFTIDATTGMLSIKQTLEETNYAVQVQVTDGFYQTRAWVYVKVVVPDSVVG
ncbi:protocadherin gamma-B1-like [Argopecten irradians]|uniref:protocadherin gamma-B1-like n=1 Tax=Argopecten irradians TaxID=31199 RepID=UPI00371E6562